MPAGLSPLSQDHLTHLLTLDGKVGSNSDRHVAAALRVGEAAQFDDFAWNTIACGIQVGES